jgi:hypothetical protein
MGPVGKQRFPKDGSVRNGTIGTGARRHRPRWPAPSRLREQPWLKMLVAA